ncbi:MAG: phosphotransferase [Anaerolineae bacterium]
MLEKPDIADEAIIACLWDHYGLSIREVTFLPLGADRNTAVYRAVATDETPYFVKLRRGAFDETAVTLPKFYSDQGVAEIIAPLVARTGRLWVRLGTQALIVYPFVEGRDAYEVDLSDRQWVELGTALRAIHTAAVPLALTSRIRRETYSPVWRESVKRFVAHLDDEPVDAVAAKLTAYLRARRDLIRDLVGRAERLALALQARSGDYIVCHSDIHAGNILITANGALYIVDWDEPILAPKERDLMYVGGGLMGTGHSPPEEVALFYQGYGPTAVDAVPLAYYRYERIVQDIAAYCEQLLLTDEGGEDREQSFGYLVSSFRPGGVLEVAYSSDRTAQAR